MIHERTIKKWREEAVRGNDSKYLTQDRLIAALYALEKANARAKKAETNARSWQQINFQLTVKLTEINGQAKQMQTERNVLAKAICTCTVYSCDLCPGECMWNEPMLDINNRPGNSLECVLAWAKQEADKSEEK